MSNTKIQLKINVVAETPAEAQRATKAALNLYYASKGQISLAEFEKFSERVTDEPGLIKMAQQFI